MSKQITAQALYDRREELAEIDGNDLHALFEVLTGDPSPAGATPISADGLRAYAEEAVEMYNAHVNGGGRGGKYLIAVANFCDAVANAASR
jgi:hypothetical protein